MNQINLRKMFMVMSCQILDFPLRCPHSDLLYSFFYAIFYHFWQLTLVLFNLNIFYQKI